MNRILANPINPNNRTVTPFKEVDVLSPAKYIKDEYSYLLKPASIDPSITPELAEKKIIKLIREAIIKQWNNNVIHVVLHSGGKDSRIISSTLASLRETMGRDWLGDVLFLCLRPEESIFLQIMEKQDWKKEEYYVYRPFASTIDYHAWLGDFSSSYLSNGFCSYLVSSMYKSLEDAIFLARGLKPKDVCLLSGNGGSEIFHPYIKLLSLTDLYDHYYHVDYYYRAAIGLWYSLFKDFFIPFTDYDLVDYVFRLPQQIRINIPQKLSSLIYPWVSDIRFYNLSPNPCWQISDKRAEMIRESYISSLFYKNSKDPIIKNASPWKISPTILHSFDQKLYSLASICDRLVKDGVEISW